MVSATFWSWKSLILQYIRLQLWNSNFVFACPGLHGMFSPPCLLHSLVATCHLALFCQHFGPGIFHLTWYIPHRARTIHLGIELFPFFPSFPPSFLSSNTSWSLICLKLFCSIPRSFLFIYICVCVIWYDYISLILIPIIKVENTSLLKPSPSIV